MVLRLFFSLSTFSSPSFLDPQKVRRTLRLQSDLVVILRALNAGVCSVFVKILKEGPMKEQAVVSWAVSFD
ncbi:hypothetical protein Lser_V15G00546 [Lactuca serriola]